MAHHGQRHRGEEYFDAPVSSTTGKNTMQMARVATIAGTAIWLAPSRIATVMRLVHVEIAVDVFDFDRGVIDQHADGEGQAAQRHDVDGVAGQVHANDGSERMARGIEVQTTIMLRQDPQKRQNHQRDQDRRKHGLAHHSQVAIGRAHKNRLIEVDLQIHPLWRGGL